MSERPKPVATDFSRVVPGRLDVIEGVSHELSQWLRTYGATPRVITSITLMLDELFTNIVVHGYGPQNPGNVQIDAEILAGSVTVTLTDDAHAFDPLLLSEPDLSLDIKERPIGGLGVHFVRRMSDSVAYRRLNAGFDATAKNEIRFVKRLTESQ